MHTYDKQFRAAFKSLETISLQFSGVLPPCVTVRYDDKNETI